MTGRALAGASAVSLSQHDSIVVDSDHCSHGEPPGWLAGWLAGWLVDWLAGWLAGWLVG